ncbi:MAG TPA: DoxX family protein [Mycobacteriales bacterium]|nr:DoxX family protein [Mycobacteriales bacterium]
MNSGRLVARVVIGGLFVGHGLQKLQAKFDGPGIEETAKMMDGIEMRPAKVHAYAAGVTETTGGTLLALGAMTPLAAASLIGTMITAIRKVHLPNGVWITNRGYEYNLVLIAALMAIVDGGPGPVSIDALRHKSRHGLPAMLGALGLGAAASTLAIELGRRGGLRDTDRQVDVAGYEAGRQQEATLPTEAQMPPAPVPPMPSAPMTPLSDPPTTA